MNETKFAELSNWLVELFTACFAVTLGAILAAVTRNKQKFEETVNNRLKALEQDSHDHETRLAVIQTCQTNTAERLTDIKETTEDTNSKIENIGNTMTTILVALGKTSK